MTNQDAFDVAVCGVIWQGCASKTSVGGSLLALRGDNHTKCAIGHLIPDGKYTRAMEDRYLFIAAEMGVNADLAFALRAAHDGASNSSDFMSSFIRSAAEVAAHFGLKFEVPA